MHPCSLCVVSWYVGSPSVKFEFPKDAVLNAKSVGVEKSDVSQVMPTTPSHNMTPLSKSFALLASLLI